VSLRKVLLHITAYYTFRPFLCYHQGKIKRKRTFIQCYYTCTTLLEMAVRAVSTYYHITYTQYECW